MTVPISRINRLAILNLVALVLVAGNISKLRSEQDLPRALVKPRPITMVELTCLNKDAVSASYQTLNQNLRGRN